MIFKYDAQIYSCCHVGGGMGFDSEGNLYVTTGDTNSSQGTQRLLGQQPDRQVPDRPADEAVERALRHRELLLPGRAPDRGQHQRLQRQDAAVPADPDLPDGCDAAPSASGTTYTLPDARLAERPEPVQRRRRAGDRRQTGPSPRSTPWACATRSACTIDPETDIPYTAWVGPDAGGPSATAGPVDVRERGPDHARRQLRLALLHGQQAGLPRPRSPTAACAPTNPPGYVPGGPATGGTDGWYDCDNLRNDSPNNTGLVELPHETGTGDGRGQGPRPRNLWYSRGNPDNANGCPEFPRPRGDDARARTTAPTPTQLLPVPDQRGHDGHGRARSTATTTTAADNSRRWPEYWDGRWFLHNNGGPSVKHGLLLDPATVRHGGQPVYADSLPRRPELGRGPTWTRSSAPDGALYVQVYDGFFRAGQNAGICRFDYMGGAGHAGREPARVPDRRQPRALLERRLGRHRVRVGLRRRQRRLDRGEPDAQVRRAPGATRRR